MFQPRTDNRSLGRLTGRGLEKCQATRQSVCACPVRDLPQNGKGLSISLKNTATAIGWELAPLPNESCVVLSNREVLSRRAATRAQVDESRRDLNCECSSSRFLYFWLAVMSGPKVRLPARRSPKLHSHQSRCNWSLCPRRRKLTWGPERQRVVDKKFVIVLGALGLAEAMHFTTRTPVLEHEQTAGAPWVTSLPSHPGLIATNAAIFASEVLVAYEMKKRHDWLPGDRIIRKLWWMYPAVVAVPHVKSAVHNIRLQAPAGCTSPDCQSP